MNRASVVNKFVDVAFVIVPFVANKFVVVAFVDVVFAKYPFQRSDDEPRDKRASTMGLKLVVAPPVTARLVAVALVAVSEVPMPVVNPRRDANKLVLVAFVPVAFTKSRLVEDVWPITERSFWNVKSAVEVPPAN